MQAHTARIILDGQSHMTADGGYEECKYRSFDQSNQNMPGVQDHLQAINVCCGGNAKLQVGHKRARRNADGAPDENQQGHR